MIVVSLCPLSVDAVCIHSRSSRYGNISLFKSNNAAPGVVAALNFFALALVDTSASAGESAVPASENSLSGSSGAQQAEGEENSVELHLVVEGMESGKRRRDE